jgi:transposase-like protein
VYSTDPRLEPDHAPRLGPTSTGMPDLEVLRDIQGKCAVKSEACHWALERMTLRQDGADMETEIRPRDREVQSKANVYDSCYLWMSGLFSPTPETAEAWVNLAENFQTLASIAEVLQDVLTHQDVSGLLLEDSVDLAAEVQSALRIAVQDVGQRYDPDQIAFFRWLRQFANIQQIFIQRHMRESDPADPAAWTDMQERIAQLDEKRQTARNVEKRRKKLLGKVRYHAGKVSKAEGEGDENDWARIAESVDALIEDGLAPSNKDLRNCLMPIVDDLPDLAQDTPNFSLVLREIDRYQACAPAVGGGPPERLPGPELEEARSLLAGKTLVIIGGEERPEAKGNLEQQLALKEAIWVPGNHHQSVLEFKPYVEREDVHLVCLLIKWSSHGFGDVKSFCDACDKPLVRLPGGYSPNQVAHHVVTQAGKRLRSGQASE